MQKAKNRVAIICALSREIKAVKEEIKFNEQIEYLNYKFEIGTLNDKEIILCQLGIGKVNAAVVTTILIEKFNPDLIINVGIAAGFAEYLKTLDVVVAEGTLYHDANMTDGSDTLSYGQIEGLPLVFPVVENVNEYYNIIKNNTSHNVYLGKIATGDQFVTDYEYEKKKIDTKLKDLNILAMDMESASVGHVCYLYKKPVLIIRSISDCLASPTSQFDYFEFADKASLRAAKMLKSIL